MRAITPGAKFSTSTSNFGSISRTIRFASAVRKFMHRLFLPRLSLTKAVPRLLTWMKKRYRSPVGPSSILITSAPISARRWVPDGPAITCVMSRTLIPFMIPLPARTAILRPPGQTAFTEAPELSADIPPQRKSLTIRFGRRLRVAACRYTNDAYRSQSSGGIMRTFGVHTGQQDCSLEELRLVWRFVDRAGFDWLSVWDHFYEAPPIDGSSPCFETISALALMAVDTSSVLVGCLVFCVSYRHPAVLAKALAR